MTAAKIAQEADTMKKREHTRSGNLSGCFLASEELIIMVFAWGAYLLSSTGKRIYYPILGIY
jgi:hypothetical protein